MTRQTTDGTAPPSGEDAATAGRRARLDVRNVTKAYRTGEGPASVAVRDVSFHVDDGEFVSLVGPSGCGKTTLLKACAGLAPITDGTIDFEGTGAPAQPGRYGMVFQTPTMLPWWNVLDNVLLPARVLRLDPRPARTRALELLDLVGLGGVHERYPGELSGGMQQRASLARALLHRPDMVFMDEPFGALDAITRDAMNELLQRVQRELGQTILFVTHSISEAVWLSDRVLVMSVGPGRLVADVEIDFPRPRRADLVADARFRELEVRLKAGLETPADAVTTPGAVTTTGAAPTETSGSHR